MISPEYCDGLRKYAEILEDNHCSNQDNDLAIDNYKKCLDLIDENSNKNYKTQIAVRLERLYRKMGRDEKIKEIQEYLEMDKGSDMISDDEDMDDDGSFF